jgi:hypothetical protein
MKLNGILNFVQNSNSLSQTQIGKHYQILQSSTEGSKLDKYIAANVAKNVPIERVRMANRFLLNGNLDGALNILSGKSVHSLSTSLGISTDSLRAEFKAALDSVSRQHTLAKQTRVKEIYDLDKSQLLKSTDPRVYKELLDDSEFIKKFNARYRHKGQQAPARKVTVVGVLKGGALVGGAYILLRMAGKIQNANTGCFLISLRNDFKCKLSSRSCSSDKRKGNVCHNPVAQLDPDQCAEDTVSACKNCFCGEGGGFNCGTDFKVECIEQTLGEALDELMEGVYEKVATVFEKSVEYLYTILRWLPYFLIALFSFYIWKTIKNNNGQQTSGAAEVNRINV